jgi:hypothetical protein
MYDFFLPLSLSQHFFSIAYTILDSLIIVKLSFLASCIAWPLLRQGRRKLFSIGGGGGKRGRKARANCKGPRQFLNLESLKCHFLDFNWGRFNRILMVRKQRFSMLKFTI